MGAERYTLAAVYADERLRSSVKINGVDRASLGTFSTFYTQFSFDKHPAALSLEKGPCWTGQSAGGRIAGQTGFWLKARS